ncbi:MAG: DNA repair protein RecO [Spirochaetaceae bacterium]
MRTARLEAVVLRARPFGDIHRSVTLMTAEEGLITAVAYGAGSRKGRLRGLVAPFHRGICYLYTNPVKNQSKITDFDVLDYYSGIREGVDRFYAASLCAEVLLRSFGGAGESRRAYELLHTVLPALDGAPDHPAVRRAVVQFLWRYFDVIGSRPDLDRCVSCGRGIGAEEDRLFRPFATGVLCGECGAEQGRRLMPGAVRYLLRTGDRPFGESLGVGLAESALSGLAAFVFALAEGVLDRRLNTIRTGGGIL